MKHKNLLRHVSMVALMSAAGFSMAQTTFAAEEEEEELLLEEIDELPPVIPGAGAAKALR